MIINNTGKTIAACSNWKGKYGNSGGINELAIIMKRIGTQLIILILGISFNVSGQINYLDLKNRTLYADYLKIDTSVLINKGKIESRFWIEIPKKTNKEKIFGDGGIGYSYKNSNGCGFYAGIAIKKDSIFISTQSHRSIDFCLTSQGSFSQIIWDSFGGGFEAKYTIENKKMIIKNDKVYLILDLTKE